MIDAIPEQTVPGPKLYGIIGHPLGHSLSPLLHNAAFAALDIPGVFLAWPTPPEKLAAFMDAARLLRIEGLCVTIPHKTAVIPFLDSVSERVRATGAANLVYRDGDRLCGDNTDVLGFMQPFGDDPPAAASRALILGAGGAARAAAVGLLTLGVSTVMVSSRTPERSAELAGEFGATAISWEERGDVVADIVVNATPMGMTGRFARETPYPAEFFAGRTGLAYDTVYTPLRTRLLAEAAAAGWRTASGLDMFLGQADHQFRTWTGHGLPGEAKRKAAERLKADFPAFVAQ